MVPTANDLSRYRSNTRRFFVVIHQLIPLLMDSPYAQHRYGRRHRIMSEMKKGLISQSKVCVYMYKEIMDLNTALQAKSFLRKT